MKNKTNFFKCHARSTVFVLPWVGSPKFLEEDGWDCISLLDEVLGENS